MHIEAKTNLQNIITSLIDLQMSLMPLIWSDCKGELEVSNDYKEIRERIKVKSIEYY